MVALSIVCAGCLGAMAVPVPAETSLDRPEISSVAEPRLEHSALVTQGAISTVGSFSYRVETTERTKAVPSAPDGYATTWKESVTIIKGVSVKDAGFTLFMRSQAERLQRSFYASDGETEQASFFLFNYAGEMGVDEDVLAASPDIISVSLGTGFYVAGMAHPNSQDVSHVVWSRRYNRPLTQADVFAVQPDRALRRLALSRYDNRENLTNADDPNGLPLSWDDASIGPDGITWSFEPYQLGGYLSAGSATIKWKELKPYLHRELPFLIDAIREAPPDEAA